MKKITQQQFDDFREYSKQKYDDISQEMAALKKDLSHEQIERRTEDVSMSNNLMKRIHERMVELDSGQKQLKQKDTVILNLSLEIEDMRTERIFLKTQLRKLVKETKEIEAALQKAQAPVSP